MSASLSVPEALREQVAAFVSDEGLSIEVVSDSDATVRAVESEERLPCNLTTLQVGGWIACPTARAVAEKLGVGGRKMSALLNILDIKVRACELGCFE
ncbi:MAG: hypothetical protein JXQ75_10600 [Phycisphaerae bacterium]|nr:hypothetical protein [Phycisphaerae bacterium]